MGPRSTRILELILLEEPENETHLFNITFIIGGTILL